MAEVKPDYEVLIGLRVCPRADMHDPEGEKVGLVGFSTWARRKAETHRQYRCPGCGLYKVWKPKPLTA